MRVAVLTIVLAVLLISLGVTDARRFGRYCRMRNGGCVDNFRRRLPEGMSCGQKYAGSYCQRVGYRCRCRPDVGDILAGEGNSDLSDS